MSSNAAEQDRLSSLAAEGRANRMDRVESVVMILGRALLAALFIFAAVAKIADPKPFLDHMIEFGVPTFLLPAVIALELAGGLAILIGWRVREAGAALAIFCVMAACIFHYQIWIKPERTLFFKDLAIAGGLFMIAVNAARQRKSSGR